MRTLLSCCRRVTCSALVVSVYLTVADRTRLACILYVCAHTRWTAQTIVSPEGLDLSMANPTAVIYRMLQQIVYVNYLNTVVFGQKQIK